jgi:hypothetical protein
LDEDDEDATGGGVRSGPDIRNESKLSLGFSAGIGGLIGLNVDDGTGF